MKVWDARSPSFFPHAGMKEKLRGFGYGGSYAAVRRYAIGWRKEHGTQQGERPMPRELEG